eukprot:TRINITY_DN16875_c0_g3_i3.p3 TRINITY_DN16875_c0_g3~~TRINITY_DN16875_c0_g3_i3.p3  ORF type:complete len:149 (+),score=26.28 TRINITY_DN16875_c0_g3_i3:885-1331(+)
MLDVILSALNGDTNLVSKKELSDYCTIKQDVKENTVLLVKSPIPKEQVDISGSKFWIQAKDKSIDVTEENLKQSLKSVISSEFIPESNSPQNDSYKTSSKIQKEKAALAESIKRQLQKIKRNKLLLESVLVSLLRNFIVREKQGSEGA